MPLRCEHLIVMHPWLRLVRPFPSPRPPGPAGLTDGSLAAPTIACDLPCALRVPSAIDLPQGSVRRSVGAGANPLTPLRLEAPPDPCGTRRSPDLRSVGPHLRCGRCSRAFGSAAAPIDVPVGRDRRDPRTGDGDPRSSWSMRRSSCVRCSRPCSRDTASLRGHASPYSFRLRYLPVHLGPYAHPLGMHGPTFALQVSIGVLGLSRREACGFLLTVRGHPSLTRGRPCSLTPVPAVKVRSGPGADPPTVHGSWHLHR